MDKNKVCVVILNYNNFDDTIECVRSLRKSISDKYLDIVIVDNNSNNNSISEIEKRLQGIILLKNDVNKGYAHGNNIGIKYSRDNNYRYTCLLNNDTIVTQNFLKECVARLLDETVAFVTPTLMEYSNKEFVQSTGGDIIINKGKVTRKNYNRLRTDLPKEIETDYVGGACMVFKTKIIDKLGFIPENYFLFYEETEWCYQAKKNGYKNICLTEVYIYHKGSIAINRISGLSGYLMSRNRVIFVKRNINSTIKYNIFVFGLLGKELLKIIFKKADRKIFNAYIDGIKNRFDSQYSDVMKDFLNEKEKR